jgi:hypothetical protein
MGEEKTMITKKPAKKFPFKKSPAWNIFDIFDEAPRSKQATMEMKALCDKFYADYYKLSGRYAKEGLADSASRDMVLRYISEKFEPWRKLRRERFEKGLGELPYRR